MPWARTSTALSVPRRLLREQDLGGSVVGEQVREALLRQIAQARADAEHALTG